MSPKRMSKKKRRKESIKKVRTLLFFCLFIGVLIIIAIYLNTMGMTVKEQATSYSQPLNLSVSESLEYKWEPEHPGRLQSVKLSGVIIGDEPVKVYLNDLLVLDSSKIEGKKVKDGKALSGFAVDEPEENATIEDGISEENSSSGDNPEIAESNETAPIDKPASEQETEEVTVKKFEEVCEETCNLPEGLNLSDYELVVEIGDAELNLREITYEIIQEGSENLTSGLGEASWMPGENFSELNETEGNITEINETEGAVIKTVQYQAVIGQPVKWKKQITPKETGSLKVELPENAESIDVNKVKDDVKTDVEASIITGEAVRDSNGESLVSLVSKILERLAFIITGKAVEEASGTEVNLEIDEQDAEYYIEYETPGPEATEINVSENEKQIIISGPDELGYEDILAYTELPKEASKNNIKLYHEVNGIRERTEVEMYDTNNNSLIDYIEWIVPHLSNQSYLLVIEISKAEHLDVNKEFVSDIYNEVKKQDGIWSEAVGNNEYVRVTFEEALDNTRDTTIYARPVSGEASIEIYISGTETKVAEFENLSGENTYKVYLTGIPEGESYDTFDLKIIGAVEFDYIVDPASSCGGTASACNSFDSNQAGCGATTAVPQYGCYWDGCSGTALSCSVLKSNNCTNQGGCSWLGCTGTATGCSGLSEASCGASPIVPQYGCVWLGCQGTAMSCTVLKSNNCTNQAGCSYGCTGSPTSCSTYIGEGYQAECETLGCTYGGSPDYLCSGYPHPCSSFTNSDDCIVVAECANYGCTGTATSCSGLSQGSCGATTAVPQYGCYWTGCTGTALTCNSGAFTSSNCSNQAGCAWQGCTGTANTCDSYDSNQAGCGATTAVPQYGCSWDGCSGTALSCSVLKSNNCTNQGGCSYTFNEECSGTYISASGAGCGGTFELGNAATLTYGATCQSDPLSTYKYTNLGLYEEDTELDCDYGLSTGDCVSTGSSSYLINKSIGTYNYYADCYASGIDSPMCSKGAESCAITWVDTTAPIINNFVNSPSSPTTYQCDKQYNFTAYIWDLALYEYYFYLDGVSQFISVNSSGTAESTLYNLAAGTHAYNWKAVDTSSNFQTTSTYNYVINKATPSGSLSSSAGWTIEAGTSTTIGYSESNCGDGDVTYKVQRKKTGETNWVDRGTGETWTPTAGVYTYVLNTTGGENYSQSASLDSKTLTVQDFTDPTTTATGVQDDASAYTFSSVTSSDYVDVTLTCSDGTYGSGCDKTYYCVQPESSCTPTTLYSGPVRISTWGFNYITFYSVDKSSNSETPHWEEVVLDEWPIITSVTVESETYAANTNITLDAVVSDPDDPDEAWIRVWCCVGESCNPSTDGDYLSCFYPYSDCHGRVVDIGAEGAKTVRCQAMDSLFQLSSTIVSDTFYADGSPPSISITSIGGDTTVPYNISDSTPSAILTTSESATCRWSDIDEGYDSMVEPCDGGGTTSHTCDLGAGWPENTPTPIYFACVDSYGNNHTSANNKEASFEIDSSPPIQSGHNPSSGSTITTTSPTITFSTNENAKCRWSLSDDAYSAMSNNCDSSYSTSHSCSVSGLNEPSDYVYIACQDDTEVYPNNDTAATNTELYYTLDLTPPFQTNVSLSRGWNMFAIISNYTATGDRNISVSVGWNLIGYSSNVSLNLSEVIFTNNSGSRYNWSQAISAGKVQAYLMYRESNRYKYVGLQGSGMHDYALRPGKAYWLYAHQAGNITLLGVGGSPPQTGQTFAFSSLTFSNGTKSDVGVSAVYNTYKWVFLSGDNKIHYWHISEYDYSKSVCGLDPNCKETVSPWEGYFIYSNYTNITMSVND